MMYGAALPLNLLSRAPGLTIRAATVVDILGNGSVPRAGGRRCSGSDADQRA